MSLATTGVSQAMPSRSTTPNDSPRSDGAQKTSAPRIRSVRSSSAASDVYKRQVLRNPDLADRLVSSGRARAEQFSMRRLADRYLEAYAEVVGERTAARIG